MVTCTSNPYCVDCSCANGHLTTNSTSDYLVNGSHQILHSTSNQVNRINVWENGQLTTTLQMTTFLMGLIRSYHLYLLINPTWIHFMKLINCHLLWFVNHHLLLTFSLCLDKDSKAVAHRNIMEWSSCYGCCHKVGKSTVIFYYYQIHQTLWTLRIYQCVQQLLIYCANGNVSKC